MQLCHDLNGGLLQAPELKMNVFCRECIVMPIAVSLSVSFLVVVLFQFMSLHSVTSKL